MNLQKLRYSHIRSAQTQTQASQNANMGGEDRYEVPYLALDTDFDACVIGWLHSILFY